MPNFRIFNPPTIHRPAGYSHVAEISSGKIVYILRAKWPSIRPAAIVGAGDFRAQVQQVFANLKAALTSVGADFSSVVKFNCYCVESVDPKEIATFREIRDQHVNTANPPASTFVVVSRLVRPEWLIEVEAVAVV